MSPEPGLERSKPGLERPVQSNGRLEFGFWRTEQGIWWPEPCPGRPGSDLWRTDPGPLRLKLKIQRLRPPKAFLKHPRSRVLLTWTGKIGLRSFLRTLEVPKQLPKLVLLVHVNVPQKCTTSHHHGPYYLAKKKRPYFDCQ